jgi:hypothetical protein
LEIGRISFNIFVLILLLVYFILIILWKYFHLFVSEQASRWQQRHVASSISRTSEKSLANLEKMMYAFNRYPISVSPTVLVQNVKSHAGRGRNDW